MLLRVALSLALLIAASVASAEPPPPTAPGAASSVQLQPTAIYDKDGNVMGGPGAPIMVMILPFVRSGSGDPIIFDNIGTTPKQFAITKPADATTYRFINTCNVDVRIRKVGSMSEQVTVRTGTPYLARTETTMGTSNPVYLSLMTMTAPATTCSPEMQYGRAGG